MMKANKTLGFKVWLTLSESEKLEKMLWSIIYKVTFLYQTWSRIYYCSWT